MRRVAFLVLAIAVTRPAMAAHYVKDLRSGKVVVCVPSALFFAVASPDGGDLSRSRAAVLPVLLRNPQLPSDIKAYRAAIRQLDTPGQTAFLRPYAAKLKDMSMEAAFLSLGRQSASGIRWMGGASSVEPCPHNYLLTSEGMRHLASYDKKDATVFIRPIVVSTSALDRVYLIVRVSVYGGGPVHAFFIGAKTLYSEMRLAATVPQRREPNFRDAGGVERVAAARARVRAAAWMAKNAMRLKQAITVDVKDVVGPLSDYMRAGF